jgi:hypothetical protein
MHEMTLTSKNCQYRTALKSELSCKHTLLSISTERKQHVVHAPIDMHFCKMNQFCATGVGPAVNACVLYFFASSLPPRRVYGLSARASNCLPAMLYIYIYIYIYRCHGNV